MKLLLDTHTLIWLFEANERLPIPMRELIANRSNELYVSTATFWEIQIKFQNGRLDLKHPVENMIILANEEDLSILPVEAADVVRLGTLPLRHKDPFDRIIIAQAIRHELTIIGRDVEFDKYPVKRLW